MGDRPYFLLMLAVLISGLAYTIFCLVATHVTDIQVITQYSGVGDTHFYKDKWFSLYTFAGFGVIVTAIHLALLAKLFQVNYRDIGIVIAWIALLIMLIATVYTYEVFHLAFL